MGKLLHFLVVEDETDIADLLILLLSQEFSATFSYAQGGYDAIDLIEKNPAQYDLIFCDYRMVHGNGDVVIEFLKNKGLAIPLVLATSDDRSDHLKILSQSNIGYIQKPFDDVKIREEVRRLLMNENQQEDKVEYVPISVATLARINDIKSNLYIKLNDQKYVRLQKSGTSFDLQSQEKLIGKGVSVLYVVQSEYNQLIEEFQDLVNSRMALSSDKDLDAEALKLSSAVQEVLSGFVKSFGLSEQTEILAKKNIALVNTIVKRTESLDSLMGWILKSELGFSYQHSTLLTIILSELVPHFKFPNDRALEILTLAAFLHDSTLNDYQSKNEDRFIGAMQMGLKINVDDLEMIKAHPSMIAEQLGRWPHCPPELLEIISTHHEKPDGLGFPKGLRAEQVSTYATFFIVCEEFVKTFLEAKSIGVAAEQWKKKEAQFESTQFKEIYTLIQNRLLNVSSRAAS